MCELFIFIPVEHVPVIRNKVAFIKIPLLFIINPVVALTILIVGEVIFELSMIIPVVHVLLIVKEVELIISPLLIIFKPIFVILCKVIIGTFNTELSIYIPFVFVDVSIVKEVITSK
jgi:hypothetical protein